MKKKRPPKVVEPRQLDADLAVKGFFKDKEWSRKLGIGTLVNTAAMLLATTGLLLPLSLALMGLVAGYSVRFTRDSAKELSKPVLPEWNQWTDMFMSGLTWLSLQFVLSLVAFSTIAVAVGLSTGAYDHAKEHFAATTIAGGLCSLVAVTLLHFLGSYLFVNFALKEKVGAGLDVRAVASKFHKRPRILLEAWLLSIGLQIGALIVPPLTIIGVFFVPMCIFGSQMATCHLLTQAWTSIPDEPVQDETQTDVSEQTRLSKKERAKERLKQKKSSG